MLQGMLLLNISILLKERNLDREEDITVNLEVNVQGGYIMGRDAKIEPFCFEMDVLGSTRRPTIFNKLAVVFLQRIMTPSFVSLEIFALFIPYLCAF